MGDGLADYFSPFFRHDMGFDYEVYPFGSFKYPISL